MDVKLTEPIDIDVLRSAGPQFTAIFGEPREQLDTTLQLTVGSGQMPSIAPPLFSGWLFPVRDTFALKLQPSGFSLHSVRSSNWPSGDYVGWDTIRRRLDTTLDLLIPTYGSSEPKRVGLRYLNRLSLPAGGTELTEWFTIPAWDVEILDGLHGFSSRATYARVAGYDGLSATVGLSNIPVPEDRPDLRLEYGFLLDLDIFNLMVRDAPDFGNLSTYFEDAHEVENNLFELAITDRLRERFG